MKRGIRTSEFWLTFLPTAFTLFNQCGMVGKPIPLQIVAVVFCGVIAYAISRGWVKSSSLITKNGQSFASVLSTVNMEKNQMSSSKISSIVTSGLALLSTPAISAVVKNLEGEASDFLAKEVSVLVQDPAERQAGAQLAGGLKLLFAAIEASLLLPASAPVPTPAG